jgi:hypothetical protein
MQSSPPDEPVHQHRPGTSKPELRPLIRGVPGSVWANVAAILSVAGTIGALYLPLVVD